MQDKSFKIKDSGGFLSVQLKNIYLVPSVLGTVKLVKIIFSLARRSIPYPYNLSHDSNLLILRQRVMASQHLKTPQFQNVVKLINTTDKFLFHQEQA